MQLVVSITAEDIAHGVPGSTITCPAARATRRALVRVAPSSGAVRTYPELFHIGPRRIVPPGPVTTWMLQFDRQKYPGQPKVGPITFTLTI